MVEHRVDQGLAGLDDPARGQERLATLVSGMREARRYGEIVRMAELAREMASVLELLMQDEAHGPAEVEGVLAEAKGRFLTDPSWPDRLIAATDLLCSRSAE
ncbi:hypothetical protein [Streptomyces sp. NPDC001652]|uniref:hypothetical protein n=1 Tax=Streptomyces sp. NPDC001652 TaxID=3154393 RepID=UPI0033246BCB